MCGRMIKVPTPHYDQRVCVCLCVKRLPHILTTHHHRSVCVCVLQQDDVTRCLTGERQADHLAGQLQRAGAVHRPRPLDAGAALPDPRHGCVGPGDSGGRPGRTHLHAGCHTLPCDAVPPLQRSGVGTARCSTSLKEDRGSK